MRSPRTRRAASRSRLPRARDERPPLPPDPGVAARVRPLVAPFDVIAGLTLWGLVVPEGMAYAGIAGLPPQAGLYTLVVSLLVYALLGTSRHLSVGGTSATAALLASSVAAALVASAVATDVRSADLRRLRGRLRARHRPGVPGRRHRPPRLHHPVPVQAGDGRLRRRPRRVRDGRAAQQALRRGEARREHRREAGRHRPRAARRRASRPSPWERSPWRRCSCCRA